MLLVDDVITTGAAACARKLLGTASERVVLAVACATPTERPWSLA